MMFQELLNKLGSRPQEYQVWQNNLLPLLLQYIVQNLLLQEIVRLLDIVGNLVLQGIVVYLELLDIVGHLVHRGIVVNLEPLDIVGHLVLLGTVGLLDIVENLVLLGIVGPQGIVVYLVFLGIEVRQVWEIQRQVVQVQ